MPHGAGRAVVDEQPRLVAARGGAARSARRQVVVQLRDVHPIATVTSLGMDAEANRTREARLTSRGGRVEPAQVDAAFERARDQVEALAAAAAELESTLPARVGDAVQDGLRARCCRSPATSPRCAA